MLGQEIVELGLGSGLTLGQLLALADLGLVVEGDAERLGDARGSGLVFLGEPGPRFLFRSWMTPIALPSCRIGMPRICWVLKPVFLSQDPSKLKVGEIRASSALS